MGGFLTSLWGSNDPDPVTGLTPRQIHLVTSTFADLKKDITASGVLLFMKLFERKPEYQDYFPFRDIPRDQLETSPKFKAHCVTVMYSVSSIVENLNNVQILQYLLLKIGESHAKHNLQAESFDVLQEVFLDVIKEALASKINDETITAWDKTLTVAFTIIKEALKNK